MKKKIFTLCLILSLTILNNCVQSTVSFFGPTVTVARTGNIYHGGLSYASNKFVKKKFGEDPLSYAKKIFIRDSKKNDLIKSIKSKKIPEKELLSSFKRTQSEHKDFLTAVKKMLK
tara:strand:- start:25 stop:372 length:348 start_codon:yes stop_codon:yes gene_type:complete